jgi:hypothetical protein
MRRLRGGGQARVAAEFRGEGLRASSLEFYLPTTQPAMGTNAQPVLSVLRALPLVRPSSEFARLLPRIYEFTVLCCMQCTAVESYQSSFKNAQPTNTPQLSSFLLLYALVSRLYLAYRSCRARLHSGWCTRVRLVGTNELLLMLSSDAG